MEDIRSVLKAFLARYPYCYGYWKKYTDLEKKRGTAELCQEVRTPPLPPRWYPQLSSPPPS